MPFFKKETENDYETVALKAFNKLLSILKKKSNIDLDIIIYAKEYAQHYHKHQKRISGEPYYIHTIEVSIILAKFITDQDIIIAALLHDVVEDTKMVLSHVGLIFGSRVKYLVDKLTKLDNGIKKLKLTQNEKYDKLIKFKKEDKYITIIKIADRIHNMRTLSYIKSPQKRKRIAEETLNVFVPLAYHFNLTSFADELEYLAYKTLNAIS
ncbi:MAG: bifunctional (p)ppGpp synthetase/guanosine-3',5'-bis(diphosphate) 3'-pyrophosphohydrolase [Bacteroidetes bacterium]|nr:bifunctional (p)ppGpp synthetase/guanosine-3',5'-bis(diphosphate) 3'-pyrophosphohydrolase [Bacteroidota bacterium]